MCCFKYENFFDNWLFFFFGGERGNIAIGHCLRGGKRKKRRGGKKIEMAYLASMNSSGMSAIIAPPKRFRRTGLPADMVVCVAADALIFGIE